MLYCKVGLCLLTDSPWANQAGVYRYLQPHPRLYFSASSFIESGIQTGHHASPLPKTGPAQCSEVLIKCVYGTYTGYI